MRLASMTIKNGHRRVTDDITTGPVTLFVGRNGRGKSTRLGIPELVLAPTVRGAYPVLGNTDYDWSASLRFENGTTVARFVTKQKPGVAVDGIPMGVQQAAKDLPEIVGASATLSIGAFLALHSRDRMTWLQDHVLHGSGWSANTATAKLAAVASENPAVADDIRAAIGADGRAVLRDAWKRLDEASKAGGREVTRLQGAIALAESAEAGIELPEGDVASWRVKLDELRVEDQKVREQRGSADQAAREAARVQKKREKDRTDLEALQATDLDKLAAQAEELVTQAEAARVLAAGAVDSASEAYRKADVVAQEKSASLVAAQASARLNPQLTSWVSRLTDLGVLDVAGEIQSLIDVSTEGEQQLFDAATRQRVAADRSLVAAKQALAGAERDVRDATAKRERQKKARNEHGDQCAVLAKAIEEAGDRVAELEGIAGNLDTLDALLLSYEEQRKAAQRNVDVLTDNTNARATLMIHRAAQELARSRQSEGRAARDAVELLLGELMNEAVGPFLGIADRITSAVLGYAMNIDLREGFGWSLGTADDSHGEGSRSENAVAVIALRVAIVSGQKGWRSVVLDDFENLDAERRQRLLEVMVAEAARGTFDNFLVAGVIAPGTTYPDGVTVHEL